MPLRQICKRLEEFRDERNWGDLHTPESLSRALVVEAGELDELFLWGRSPSEERLQEELADVMIYALNICNVCGYDPVKMINQKIDKNAIKYPLQTLPHPTK